MGAYGADGRPVAGPAFVFLKPEEGDDSYTEMPRLVRLAEGKAELTLTFSAPLASLYPVRIRVKAGKGKEWVDAIVSGRVLQVKLSKELAGRSIKRIWLPDDLKGVDGEYVTLWSSVFAGLKLYKTGEVSRVAPPRPVCFCDCGAED